MRCIILATIVIVTACSLFGSSITVDTDASVIASYGTVGETAGPFPWSDLGITAGASISGGILNVGTGGSTSFSLNTPITGSEVFTPGSTTLQLGYTSAWTGSITSVQAANGNLNSSFVYNIGPISGSDNLFNVPITGAGVNSNLSSSLNAGLGIPVVSSSSATGPGVGASLTLKAQAFCPFCVTVASASVGINVGSRVDQSVIATPIVTNADLVWYSTSQTYSPTDTFTLVTGSGGDINNTFTAPSGLGLVNGQTFYMNILPVEELTMPVTNVSDVAVPASITASWEIFGSGSSANYPLGDLYTLSNGESFDFDPTFYGDFFYSQPLVYNFSCVAVACFASYTTPATSSGPDTDNTGIPTDIPPTVTLTGGGPVPGGYGTTNLGPLFPGDPSTGDICGPVGTAYAGECITQITLESTPEPDSIILAAAGLLLLAGRSFAKFRKNRNPR